MTNPTEIQTPEAPAEKPPKPPRFGWEARHWISFHQWTTANCKLPDNKADDILRDRFADAQTISVTDACGAVATVHCDRDPDRIRKFCQSITAFTQTDREAITAAALTHARTPDAVLAPEPVDDVGTPFLASAPEDNPANRDMDTMTEALETIINLKSELAELRAQNALLKDTIEVQQLALKAPVHAAPRPESVITKTLIQCYESNRPDLRLQNDKEFTELLNGGWQPLSSHANSHFTAKSARHYLITVFKRAVPPPTASIDAAIQAALSARPDPDQPILRQTDLRTPEAILDPEPTGVGARPGESRSDFSTSEGTRSGTFADLLRTGHSLDDIKDAADLKAIQSARNALSNRRPPSIIPLVQLIPEMTQ